MNEAMDVYLVRVWRHGGDVRASVVQVGTEAPSWFTEAQALGEHLLQAADRVCPTPTGAHDDDHAGESDRTRAPAR